MDDRNTTSGRSSEEIRAEIDRTRAEMHNTVDQLEARLSPGQILDELWGRMRTNGGGSAGELVREHPIPLALMGLGVAMLAVEHSKHKNSHSDDAHGYIGDRGRAEGRKGPYRGDEIDDMKFSDLPSDIGSTSDTGDGTGHGIKNRMSNMMHGASDAVSGAASGAAEKLSGVKDSVSGAASGLKDRASELADGAGERLHGMGDRASELRGRAGESAGNALRGLDRVIHDQPLIAGALTFGLGLAAGLAVPTTRFEDERLGRTSDQLKDTAKQTASQVGEKALEVATQTVAAAKDAVSEIKDEINDPELKDALMTKARTIVDVAKTTVGDSMQNVTGALAASGTDAESQGSSDATSGSSTLPAGSNGSTRSNGSTGSTGSTGSGASGGSYGDVGRSGSSGGMS
jgi:ElaB/YqjD/DUF883 family membrane-anchored ribosome-binding protein